jgi:hypothetical protein
MNEENNERLEKITNIDNKNINNVILLDDIRNKEWLKKDSTVSDIQNKLIEVENLLISLDEYNTNNGLNYDYLEDFMLQIGEIRETFSNYVDKNLELTDIKLK